VSETVTNLETTIAGVRLRNPVILAAGTCGTLDEMSGVLDLSQVGGVVTKSITLRPREGNPTWRIIESRCGMLNAIGLANVGIDHFMEHVAPRVGAVPAAVIGSVAGFSVEDYVRVAAHLQDIEALAAIELNVSCPNVRGGVEFGVDPIALAELVSAVRAVVGKPLFVKLSPIATGHPSMVEVARAAIEPGRVAGRGADALCIANTIPAMEIDIRTRRPRLANVTGGLSGPAVHPVAVKLVHEVYRAVARDAGVPLIGIGGVMTWRDAAEFVLAGAGAVQMGTALFANPRSPIGVVKGLERWVRTQRRANVGELVGAVILEPVE
jgi:dihydroorotate dehydrogenase (NAD+) catalytic subunit